MAGAEMVARHFPFRIGRATDADLVAGDEGVWDRHLELAFDPVNGFLLRAEGEALATLNGESFNEAILRNGDLIQIGGLKLRFWLSRTRQTGLGVREWLTWIALGLITASQLVLIYRLVP